MDCVWCGDFVLGLFVLFLAGQIIYWLVLQGAVLWVIIAAIQALGRYHKGG